MTLRTAAVPGPPFPRFDAGRLCLDLLATTHPHERLPDLPSLTTWITASGLLPPSTPLPDATPPWLTSFRELRDAVGHLIHAVLHPEGVRRRAGSYDAGPYDAGLYDAGLYDAGSREGVAYDVHPYDRPLAVLNDAARPAPPVPRAVLLDDGRLTSRLAEPPTCPALLSTLARDALDLLTDPGSLSALRQCEGDNCPIVYLDTSRGRRRRWCSSEICGNRERVARHRRRAALARA
ncbi:CGNR zinc finger domain-containing protein [Streptomyces sp. NPDC004539]|uniref:CGNR zinc finger domain-containing protein n=1 Tax=Streptomyces sp. NPDC004539 TaxID=3154280 RepID=UPI0033A7436B